MEIDELNKELDLIFLDLKDQIAKVENRIRSLELDLMYNNVEKDVYLEKIEKIGKKVSDLRGVLEGLRKAEKELQQDFE